MWQTALAWSKNSATHLWANVVIAVSIVGGMVAQFSDNLLDSAGFVFDDPELKVQVTTYLQSHVSAEVIPLMTIGIAVVTKIARNRTLKK